MIKSKIFAGVLIAVLIYLQLAIIKELQEWSILLEEIESLMTIHCESDAETRAIHRWYSERDSGKK